MQAGHFPVKTLVPLLQRGNITDFDTEAFPMLYNTGSWELYQNQFYYF